MAALLDAIHKPVITGRAKYSIAILTALFTLNYIDRQILVILSESIKGEFGLRDWQLGLLTGVAFTLFYAVAAFPIAKLAEAHHRGHIIAVAAGAWSAFTALSAFASSFLALVVCRVGVGAAEAGLSPAASSLISDYMPREKRASALATYAMGAPIGTLLGLMIGGLVAGAFGWRAALLVCGVPGILTAIVAWLSLMEPRTKVNRDPGSLQHMGATIRETLRVMSKKPSFWLNALGTCGFGTLAGGLVPFFASFFLRNHSKELALLASMVGLSPLGLLGTTFGLMAGVGGILGAFIGGKVSDRLALHDIRAYTDIPAVSAVVGIPTVIFVLFSPSFVLAILAMGVVFFLVNLGSGSQMATTQTVAPREMRATATAINLFILSVISFGCGPLVFGAISDWIAGTFALSPGEGLRWSLTVATSLLGISTFLYYLARKTIRTDAAG